MSTKSRPAPQQPSLQQSQRRENVNGLVDTFLGTPEFALEVKREIRAQSWSDFCFCLALLAIIAGVVVAVLEVK